MNREELLDAVAQKTHMSKRDINAALDATLSTIADSLRTGDKVTLVGFGTFQVKERAPRVGRNPRTGQPMTIEARKAATFTPGKALNESLGSEKEKGGK
jgi:DNA-binding protein HU-beta